MLAGHQNPGTVRLNSEHCAQTCRCAVVSRALSTALDAIATGSLCGRRRMAKGPDNKSRVRRKRAGALGRISPDCAARTRRCIMLFLLRNSLP